MDERAPHSLSQNSSHNTVSERGDRKQLLLGLVALFVLLIVVVVLVVVGFPIITTSLNTSLSDSRPLLGKILSKIDFDNDGKADIGVWRPSDGNFYILLSSKNYDPKLALTVPWGKQGDIPVPGRYYSKTSPDLAVWRPSEGAWYILLGDSKYKDHMVVHWGLQGDVPIGYLDFDGDGKSDLVLWRPSEGKWYVLLSTKGFDTKQALIVSWGAAGDMPF